nr:hypothetical protein [Dyella sp. ASV24]
MSITERLSNDWLRDLIADALRTSKSYDLPALCVELGIQSEVKSEDESEAFASKRSYVKRRIASWKLPELTDLAERVFHIFPSDALEDAITQLASSPTHRLSEIVRRDILKELNFLGPLFGDLDLVDTLQEIFGSQPFVDKFQFLVPGKGLADQIVKHAIHNDDWSHEVLLIECGALTCTQSRFIALIEKLLHPVARRDKEQAELATRLNPLLQREGFQVVITGYASTFPVYGVVRSQGGTVGAMKNLIFASIGEKPELVFRDAINNDVEIVKHADKVLTYEDPLPPTGLRWRDLLAWWIAGPGAKEVRPAKSLYLRLLSAVIKSESPGELAIFKCYYKLYKEDLGDRLPALIPQVYLHYDPMTQRQRGDEKYLARQRMDFLLMLDRGVRIVIEVDGQQHYAVPDSSGTAYRASPERYAEMVREDRRLKLRGYQVFRFGGHEFRDVDLKKGTIGPASQACVAEFFRTLFVRYDILQERMPP